jgi:hypothetical protein
MRNTDIEKAIIASKSRIAAINALSRVKHLLPRKSGNLQDNALRIVDRGNSEFEVMIDDIIAPYVNSPSVKEKIDNVWPQLVQQFAQELARELNGRIE